MGGEQGYRPATLVARAHPLEEGGEAFGRDARGRERGKRELVRLFFCRSSVGRARRRAGKRGGEAAAGDRVDQQRDADPPENSLGHVAADDVPDLVRQHPRHLVGRVGALDQPAQDHDIAAGQRERIHHAGPHDNGAEPVRRLDRIRDPRDDGIERGLPAFLAAHPAEKVAELADRALAERVFPRGGERPGADRGEQLHGAVGQRRDRGRHAAADRPSPAVCRGAVARTERRAEIVERGEERAIADDEARIVADAAKLGAPVSVGPPDQPDLGIGPGDEALADADGEPVRALGDVRGTALGAAPVEIVGVGLGAHQMPPAPSASASPSPKPGVVRSLCAIAA